MLRKIKLYGHLRKRFGREYLLDVASPAEAIRALCSVVPGFRQHITEHSEPGYRLLVSDEPVDEASIHTPIGGETIKLIPVVAGSKNALTSILIGVALIAAAYFAPGSTGVLLQGSGWLSSLTIQVGMAMVLGGVAQLLAPPPTLDNSVGNKGPEDKPAYSFSGPHMTTGQGNPVPLLLGGPMRIGGALVSMGVSAESWHDKGLGGAAGDNAGAVNPTGDGDLVPFVWAIAPN